MLSIDHLSIEFSSRPILDDISFLVNKKDRIALVGKNGAGKTTSFYMIVGRVRPDSGHIFLDDVEMTEKPMFRRARLGVGYLPQEASIFRKLSVQDNIMAILETLAISRRERRERLEELLEELGLARLAKQKAMTLSGGERRRLEITRALVTRPKFIMLDEPFAGVDPIAVEDIQHIVWRLKYRNIGILITDHNVQETLTITDRAYLLFEGKILFQGKPEDLATNKVVREKYLSNSFVLRKKDFQLIDEQKGAKEAEEDG